MTRIGRGGQCFAERGEQCLGSPAGSERRTCRTCGAARDTLCEPARLQLLLPPLVLNTLPAATYCACMWRTGGVHHPLLVALPLPLHQAGQGGAPAALRHAHPLALPQPVKPTANLQRHLLHCLCKFLDSLGSGGCR